MCSKGSPSTTTSNNQVSNQSQNSATQGQQLQTGFAQQGPTPETLALYNQFLQQAQGVSQAPIDSSVLLQQMPWTDAQNTAANYQYNLGQQGMGFVPQAADLIAQGGQSTIGQIPGVASSLLSPWAGQAVNYGMQQGQAIGDWGTSQGTAISDYAKNLAAQGPQLQQFSQGAIDQYMSPYINDVVNATQNQFTNANAQQGNVLLGQGIRSGNAFGGDRAGMAAAQMANQQQLAQAPVIAGLYNTGYNTALGEFNTQNQLASQLGQMAINGQIAGGQLGLQGLTAGSQLGMQGLGMGLSASQAANQQAIAALQQNQNAALQAGNMFGQLGGLQYSQNLAGGQQAIGASQLYPQYLQNLYATNQANAQALAAYPFQTTNWYGNLLQGIGGMTGTQQQNVNAALSNYLQNVQGTAITNATGTTTPPTQNSFLQAAGLGIAGLGLLAKRGGAVPRRAGGGPIPYAGVKSFVPAGTLQPTHMPTINTSATDIKLPNISMLTFPGLSTQGAGSAASGSSSGSSSTLGQLSNLLGNKQVSSGLKSIGSFLGGSSPQASSTSVGPDTTVSVDTTPTVDTAGAGLDAGASGQKRGGLVNYRRGGYADGGGPDDSADTFSDRFDASFPDQKQDTDTGLNLDWGAILGGQPEQDNASVPPPYAAQLAAPPDVPLPRPRPPEASAAQTMEEPPPPERQGRAGPRRIDFPGMQPQPQNFLQRWASNPLTQFGLGLASARGPGLTGVAEGLNLGVGNVMAQRAAQDRLDKDYKVDTSGPTMRMIYADHAIDTGLPTVHVMAEQGRKIGRVPAGYRLSADGTKLEKIPGGPGAELAAADETQIPESAKLTEGEGGPLPKVDVPDPAPSGRLSPDGIKLSASNYLQTGRLPPGMYRDTAGRDAIINYAAQVAKSRGLSVEQATEMWRFAPRQAGWIMGADGRQAGSLGTLIDHLDTMRELTSALQNGDNQTYNKIKNKIAKWTGADYPTNVEAGGPIVGAEIMKAIGAAGAGTGAEREVAGLNIGDLAKSPDQFAGSIDVIQKLAAGQLRTKYRQAEAIGLPKERLDTMIGKRALQVLQSLDKPQEGTTPAGGATNTAPTAPAAPATPAGGATNATPAKPRERSTLEKIYDNLTGGSAAPAKAAPTETKPTPTQKDIDYVKAHPEVRDKFIQRFGREP